MKKHVIIATSAALLSTSAFATKSRMTALGQDEDRGSQYLNDTRNKFRNAAHVNNMNNYVVTEWGADGEAEGGMFRDSGNFAYGLYFNSDVNEQQDRVVAEGIDAGNFGGTTGETADLAFDRPTNRLDLFFGGDAGVQWGARIHYASSEDESGKRENDAFGVGLGALMGDLSVYANLDFSDESTGLKTQNETAAWDGTPDLAGTFESDLGLNVGAAYDWNNWTFHADYNKRGADISTDESRNSNEVGDFEAEETTLRVGAAQVHEISSTSMVFTALDYINFKEELDGDENKENDLQATVGFEADATSWLTWRGSISQNVFISSEEDNIDGDGKKNTNRNTTMVNAGASLTFGKLMVDGRIGAGGNAGTLELDDVMTDVAVSYWF